MPPLVRAHVAVEPRPLEAAPPVVAPVAAFETRPRHVYRTRTWSATRKFAATLTVAGVGAVGAGAYLGMRSRDLRERSDALCPNPACGNFEGLRLNDDARQSARTANILFVAGGAALATGAVLWLIGRPDDELVVSPVVGDRHAGVTLGGRF